MGKVPDTTHNIQVIINDMKEQIDELASMKGKNKKIKNIWIWWLLSTGFFVNYIGCLGPQGHTHVYGAMSTNMKCRTMISRHLNLEIFSHLRDDFPNFERERSDRKKAKNHHNVVYSPLLNIEVDLFHLHIFTSY